MQSRKRTLDRIKGDRKGQRAYSVAIWLKLVLGKGSRITSYSTNKLAKLGRMSHKTAQKYERLLIEYNFAHFEGKDENQVFIINSISSHTSRRNVSIDVFDFSTRWSIYRSLQSFIFMRIQHKKDFMQHLLQARHNPKDSGEYKNARKQVKDLVVKGILRRDTQKYEEWGLTLRRIAKEIGCCVRTVERVVQFAVDNKWVKREHNFEKYYAKGVNYRDIEGFTFATKNYLFVVHPNTYCLSDRVSEALTTPYRFTTSMVGIRW